MLQMNFHQRNYQELSHCTYTAVNICLMFEIIYNRTKMLKCTDFGLIHHPGIYSWNLLRDTRDMMFKDLEISNWHMIWDLPFTTWKQYRIPKKKLANVTIKNISTRSETPLCNTGNWICADKDVNDSAEWIIAG